MAKKAKPAASTSSNPAPAKAELKGLKNATPATPATQSYIAPEVSGKEADAPAPAQPPAKAEGNANGDERAKKLDSHPAELERAEVETLSGYHWTDDEFAFVAKWWKNHGKETLKGALKLWKSAFLGDARERGDAIRAAKEFDKNQFIRRWLGRKANVDFILRHSDTEVPVSDDKDADLFYLTRCSINDGEVIAWKVDYEKRGGESEHLFDVFFGEKAQKVCFDKSEDVEPEEAAKESAEVEQAKNAE